MRNAGGMKWCVCLFAVLSWTGCCVAQNQLPRSPRDRLFTVPIYSSDGTIRIRSPRDKIGWRSPVLLHIQRVRTELARVTHLKLTPRNGILDVIIGDQTDGDTEVVLTRYRDPQGGAKEQLFLKDPSATDLLKFRRAICIAFLRLWVMDVAIENDTKPEDIPMWLLDGVIRCQDRDNRQLDLDRTIQLWSHGCLPPASELFAFKSLATDQEPAVSAVLASWFLDRRNNLPILETLLRKAAAGTKWSPTLAANLLESTDDLVLFDRKIDQRMLDERRVVKLPGLSTREIVHRFGLGLYLYPETFSETKGFGYTFQEAIVHSEMSEIRRLARSLANRIRLGAVGRDSTLFEVAKSYEVFLRALADGKKPGELSKLLLTADSMRQQLEEKVSTGELLVDR